MIKSYSTAAPLIATIVAALGAAAAPPSARAADFDYYLMALSWSPSWCAAEGDERAEQCAPDRALGFVLHGLWPQFEEGWPEHCDSPHSDPSRRDTEAMADVMGSGGLAWRQWRKHGRCTGLSADDYFALSRAAFASVERPHPAESATAAEVEAVFVAANPGLGAEELVVTCREGFVREVRVCLTPALEPRRCGADVERGACRARGALEAPRPPR